MYKVVIVGLLLVYLGYLFSLLSVSDVFRNVFQWSKAEVPRQRRGGGGGH